MKEKKNESEEFPDTNWEYIDERAREGKKEIEQSMKSSISLKEAAKMAEYQNRFRYENKKKF